MLPDDSELYPPVEETPCEHVWQSGADPRYDECVICGTHSVQDKYPMIRLYLAAIDYVDGAGLVVTDWTEVEKELKKYLYG